MARLARLARLANAASWAGSMEMPGIDGWARTAGGAWLGSTAEAADRTEASAAAKSSAPADGFWEDMPWIDDWAWTGAGAWLGTAEAVDRILARIEAKSSAPVERVWAEAVGNLRASTRDLFGVSKRIKFAEARGKRESETHEVSPFKRGSLGGARLGGGVAACWAIPSSLRISGGSEPWSPDTAAGVPICGAVGSAVRGKGGKGRGGKGKTQVSVHALHFGQRERGKCRRVPKYSAHHP